MNKHGMIHLTMLKNELVWLEQNASSVQRLKRAVIREYLNMRVRDTTQEINEHNKARKTKKMFVIQKLEQKKKIVTMM